MSNIIRGRAGAGAVFPLCGSCAWPNGAGSSPLGTFQATDSSLRLIPRPYPPPGALSLSLTVLQARWRKA